MHTSRASRSRSMHTALFALLLASACDAESPCDPGQRYTQGACLTVGAAGASGAPAGDDASAPVDAASGDDAGAVTDAGCTAAVESKLGAVCTGDADCNCASPYCAIMPNAAQGYCSLRDCSMVPDDCPSGYHCFDLSIFDPSLPRFCAQD